MEYRQLGNTGLKVSLFGLGGTVFGKHAHFVNYNSQSESHAIIAQAAEAGVNHIDTADIYSDGASETIIGQALAGRRDEFVIASKVGAVPTSGVMRHPNDGGLSRAHIMSSIEGTLRRLNTDYVDLYYAHMPDPATPIDETMRAFDDVVRQGKARYIACSNFAGWEMAVAHEAAGRHGGAVFVANQVPYNLFDRGIETEIGPCCEYYGMSIVPYYPLAQGVLSGKYRRGEPIPQATRATDNQSPRMLRYLTDDYLAAAEKLDAWAKERGHNGAQAAIAWLLTRPWVCCVVAGVTSPAQLAANLAAVEWKLDAEALNEIEAMMPGAGG